MRVRSPGRARRFLTWGWSAAEPWETAACFPRPGTAPCYFERARPGPCVGLKEAHLPALWADLASGDAATAYQAIGELSQHPLVAVQFLLKQMKPVAAVPGARLKDLLADLDHPKFTVRDKASQELTRLDLQVVPTLEKALSRKPTLERPAALTRF